MTSNSLNWQECRSCGLVLNEEEGLYCLFCGTFICHVCYYKYQICPECGEDPQIPDMEDDADERQVNL